MTQTNKFSWRNEPELMARLVSAQNEAANEHQDIMTFAGMCRSRQELERHVVYYEAKVARKAVLR